MNGVVGEAGCVMCSGMRAFQRVCGIVDDIMAFSMAMA